MKPAQLIVTTSRNVKPLTTTLLSGDPTQFYKVISFDQYKNTYLLKQPLDSTRQLWAYYKTLNQSKERFIQLGQQFDYVAFVESLVKDYQDIKANGVTINEFTDNDPLHHEVIEIFRLFDGITIDPPIDTTYAPHAYCTFNVAERYADQALFDLLYHQGIFSSWNDPLLSIDPTIHYELSLGLNGTIETIIDEIIENHIDCHDINLIFADQNQVNSAIHVLDSYHISHDQINTNDQTICNDGLITMIRYGMNKSLIDLVHLLNLGYPIPDMVWTISGMDKTIHTIDQPLLDPTIPYIDQTTLENHNRQLQRLHQAAHYFDQAFVSCSSTKQLVETCFTLIQSSPLANTTALKKIADLYNIINDDLDTAYGYRFFEQQLMMVKPSAVDYPLDALIITTITQPVSTRKISYIVGLNSTNYPGFTPLNGIVDERFVKTTSYPSLASRQAFHTKRLAWLDQSGRTIHYRFCRLDNTAKPMDLPFAFLNKAFTLVHTLNRPEQPKMNTMIDQPLHHIPSSHGLIKASISALESFDRCPFQYALSTMVHLRKPNPLFSSAMVGSLLHYQMQQAGTASNHKSLSDQVDKIKHELSSLIHDQKQLDRMIETIETTITRVDKLTDSQTSTTTYLTYHKNELTIEHPLAQFAFKGIIDRLDYTGRSYGIVDYKTSSHHLSKEKFELGEQLQLITYAYLYEFDKDVDLAYLDYVCLTPQSQSYDPYKIVKKVLVPLTAEDYLDKCYQIKRFTGQKLGNKKMPWATIKRMVLPLYNAIYERLSLPDYSPAPSAKSSPCALCAFKSICRYSGALVNRDPYIILEPREQELEAMKNEVE